MNNNIWEELYNHQSIGNIHSRLSFLNGESYRLGDKKFYNETLVFLRQVYARAGFLIDNLIDKLIRENYRFAFPEQYRKASDPTVLEWAQELSETKGIYLPLTTVAWICEIGNVNLCGTYPQWEKSAYAFEGDTNQVWYTDPLVFEMDREYILYQYDEWLSNQEEFGDIETGAFRLSVSPDHIHKANVSGGPPYEVFANIPQVDTLLINERHGSSITFYLRNSLAWGGFPGFEYITNMKVNEKQRLLTIDQI